MNGPAIREAGWSGGPVGGGRVAASRDGPAGGAVDRGGGAGGGASNTTVDAVADFIVDEDEENLPPVAVRVSSIYESTYVRPRRRRWFLLAIAALVSLVMPFANTMYLPALAAIKEDLHTTTTLTAASIAVYMFSMGIGSLLWGPIADRFGRRRALSVSSVLFLGFSIGCTLSRNIVFLVVFRAFQGLSVSAFGVASQAVIADVFPPSDRGRAMGIAMLPTLVGPVVGPLLGGGLSQALGWRSTFVAMSIMGGVVMVCVFAFLEETQHYHVLARVRTAHGQRAVAAIIESATTPVPKMVPPYRPLLLLVTPILLPHVFGVMTLYGTLYACMIVLPYALAAPPYNPGQALIGVCNMAMGLGLFIAAPLGGALTDRAARRWSVTPAGRMLIGGPAAMAVFPGAAVLFGWSMHYKLPLPVPLAACFLAGIGIGIYVPAASALISIAKQANAAAAAGALHSIMFIVGAVFVLIAPTGMQRMGSGPFVTMLAGMCVLGLSVSLFDAVRRVRLGRRATAAASDGCGHVGKDIESGFSSGGSSGVGSDACSFDCCKGAPSCKPPHRWAIGGSGRAAYEAAAAAAAAATAAMARLGALEATISRHNELLSELQGVVSHLAGALLSPAAAATPMVGASPVPGDMDCANDKETPLGSDNAGPDVEAGYSGAGAFDQQLAVSEQQTAPYPTEPQQQQQPPAATPALLPEDLASTIFAAAAEAAAAAASVASDAALSRHTARLTALEAGLGARAAALRELENHAERMEAAVGEQTLALRGRVRGTERQLDEHGAALRELLGLVRGMAGVAESSGRRADTGSSVMLTRRGSSGSGSINV